MLALLLGLSTLAPQDLVLEGVHVHTGTDATWPRVVRVREGRILAPHEEAPEGADVRRLEGHLYPGLHDAHAHLLGLGAALENVDLVGTASYREVIERVVARAAQTPEGEWIVGRGWDQNDWAEAAFPTHEALSAATPRHPVWLTRIDGHAALANARAMQMAGLGADSADPSGGEILRDEHGRPTGVLVDRAMALVGGSLPGASDEQVERRLLRAQAACLAAGITCVHDAGMSAREVDIVRRLWVQRRWGLRLHVMLSAGETDAIRRGPWQTPDRLINVRAVKGYADGALGSRGAALLDGYSDRPGHRGLLLTPKARLLELSQLCADHGFQLCVHAIGDAANRAVLDVYEATRFRHGLGAARYRVEHAQVVAEADFERFARLGVLPSMQPTHLTSDMPWAPERLGPERVRGAYAWRRFHALGLPVPFGSDFPVEGHDPRLGLFAACTTRAPGGDRELRGDQKLSRERAVRGFTLDAAYAAFLERDLGTIEAGKLADFTVFDRDLLTCPDDELLEAEVVLTVVHGVPR